MVVEPPKVGAHVTSLLDQAEAAIEEEERTRLLGRSLDLVLSVEKLHAVPILQRVLGLTVGKRKSARVMLYAKAVIVTEHFDQLELVTEIARALGTAIGHARGSELAWALDRALPVLGRLGARLEVVEVLVASMDRVGRLPSRSDDNRIARIDAQLAIAGGLLVIGDMSALSCVDDLREALAGALIMPDRLRLIRGLAAGYAFAPLEVALPRLQGLIGQWCLATDNYSTNRYFCLTALAVVDSLVHGITSGYRNDRMA